MKQILPLKLMMLSVGLFFVTSLFGQSIKDVRINEIQVRNTNGLMDEYGQYGGWIELYNAGYGKVNIAGCVLKVRGKEYRIPKGDPGTVMATQGYVVFFAAGTPDKGTFHTNFTLEDTDFIEFHDVDGKLINTFKFDPAGMVENVSYGWFEEQLGKETLMNLPAITPRACNNTEEKTSRAEIFRQADPVGVVLTITSIFVVAVALVLLFFVFKYMGNFHIKNANKKAAMSSHTENNAVQVNGKKKDAVLTNEELTAIAIALYKYSENMHDIEDMVLTINRAAKVYSPWSSKIYTLTQTPNRK